MTSHPEIWKCIIKSMPRSQWIDLQDIYNLVSAEVSLDREVFDHSHQVQISLNGRETFGMYYNIVKGPAK